MRCRRRVQDVAGEGRAGPSEVTSHEMAFSQKRERTDCLIRRRENSTTADNGNSNNIVDSDFRIKDRLLVDDGSGRIEGKRALLFVLASKRLRTETPHGYSLKGLLFPLLSVVIPSSMIE